MRYLSVLNRLKIWQKLALVGLCFMLPLGVTTYLFYRDASYKIDFADKEMAGNEYIRPLSRMLEAVGRHRMHARRLARGDGAAQAELDKAAQAVEAELALLHSVDQRRVELLATDARSLEASKRQATPAWIDKEWKKTKAARGDLALIDQSHGELIRGIRELITHVGDTSYLILDPDLDTYYVMDILLLKEPDVIDRLFQLNEFAVDLLERQAVTPDERTRLAQQTGLLAFLADGLRSDLDVAFVQSAATGSLSRYDLESKLADTGRAAVESIRRLNQLATDRLINAATLDLPAKDFSAAVLEAVKANARLWREVLGTGEPGANPGHEDAMITLRRNGAVASRTGGLLAILVAVAITLGLTFLVMRSITDPINKAVHVADQLSRGELPDRIDAGSGTDETATLLQSINNMLQHLDLRNTISLLQQSAQMLNHAVEDLERQTSEQGQVVSRQAAALQETQVTAQEIKQTSQLAARKAQDVLQIAERADEIGRSGEAAIEKTLTGMTDIRAQVQQIASTINELNERTLQIGMITQTVKDLADQSNMLALNAAIEAVRSGEHGKGFAVVAREIRSLADQSIQATNRVKEVLDSIGAAIRTAVSITEAGSQRMEGGLVQLRSSGENLRELSSIVKETSQSVRQITAAVSQQNAGISQIFTAVTDQTTMMDDTVKRLEATKQAASMVKEAVQKVSDVVKRYRI